MNFVLLLLFAIPFVIALTSILSDSFPFWYDNARDLLAAWENLHNPTLLGPPSGIPGIFYGPYWIWLLSIGLLLSKDPRIAIMIIALIPYFVIFPFIWFRFSRFFGIKPVIIGWIFFIFSMGMVYATGLWNPYPAPLLTISAVYLLLTIDWKKRTKKILIQTLLLGFLLALLINFHISFGIGFTLGAILFLGVMLFREKKHWKNYIICYVTMVFGFLTAFVPFFLFEIRHGFTQTRTVIETASHYGAVVNMKGLTKLQILKEFFITYAKLVHLPFILATSVFIICNGFLALLVKTKKITITAQDKKLLTLLSCLFVGIGFIYFTARNPVWIYHFIGVDILFLILLAFLLSKIRLLMNLSAIWAFVIVLLAVSTFVRSLNGKPYGFAEQKEVVQTILHDAKKNNYTVIAYSPSIYSYEYTYLFQWLANKSIPYDPSKNSSRPKLLYLIVPEKQTPEVQDFINFRSPQNFYKTIHTWDIKGKRIIKRELLSFNK